jgi:hypothetical protein
MKIKGDLSSDDSSLEYLKPKVDDAIKKKMDSGFLLPPKDSEMSKIGDVEEQIDFYSEVSKRGIWEKSKQIFFQNPFVPIGMAITAGVLARGIYAMKQNDSKTSQRMMRWRVGAQGATIIALIFGVLLTPKFKSFSSDNSTKKLIK